MGFKVIVLWRWMLWTLLIRWHDCKDPRNNVGIIVHLFFNGNFIFVFVCIVFENHNSLISCGHCASRLNCVPSISSPLLLNSPSCLKWLTLVMMGQVDLFEHDPRLGTELENDLVQSVRWEGFELGFFHKVFDQCLGTVRGVFRDTREYEIVLWAFCLNVYGSFHGFIWLQCSCGWVQGENTVNTFHCGNWQEGPVYFW